MLKKTVAKGLGWGQFIVTYLNLALNGQPLPTTKNGWLALGASFFGAVAIHNAAETSAGHPDGKTLKDA